MVTGPTVRLARLIIGQLAWCTLTAVVVVTVPWPERSVPQWLFRVAVVPTLLTVRTPRGHRPDRSRTSHQTTPKRFRLTRTPRNAGSCTATRHHLRRLRRRIGDQHTTPTVDDIDITGETVAITFGTGPLILPMPLAALVRELVAPRSGKARIGTPDDGPGPSRADQPDRLLSDSQIGLRLHKIGIRPQQDHSTALFTLAAELPAVILARMLDVHIQVALQWQKAPGGDRAAYAADVSHRANTTKGVPITTDRPYYAVLCDVDGVLRHWPAPGPADLDHVHGLPAGTIAAAAFAPSRLAARDHRGGPR